MRKKHLARERLKDFTSWVLSPPEATKRQGQWSTKLPLSLELGMGAGLFITSLAQKHPQEFFVGLEVKEERLLKAAQKAATLKLGNIKFILGDYRHLNEFFAASELDCIYLNCPDPWPKKRHSHRRSSTVKQLELYYKLLKTQGSFHLKTDNPEFLKFTLAELEHTHFKASKPHLIPADDPENIQTEYETRWRGLGKQIWFLEARK